MPVSLPVLVWVSWGLLHESLQIPEYVPGTRVCGLEGTDVLMMIRFPLSIQIQGTITAPLSVAVTPFPVQACMVPLPLMSCVPCFPSPFLCFRAPIVRCCKWYIQQSRRRRAFPAYPAFPRILATAVNQRRVVTAR